jgi:hypothetical protein
MNPIFKTALLTTMVIGALASCDTSKEDLIEEPELQKITISFANNIWEVVSTRTDDSESTETTSMLPVGPVHYYLYNSDRQIFVADKVVTDPSNNYGVNFDVTRGNYVIYALTGVDYTASYTEVSLTDYFDFNPEQVKSDVCFGSQTFSVTGYGDVSTTIHARHMFAQVGVTIINAPNDVVSATAIISPVYDGFGWDGEPCLTDVAAVKSTTLTLTPSDSNPNMWESGYQYTYPSIDTSYDISIIFSYDDNTTVTYQGTLQTGIVAGHKRMLNGTIQKNMPQMRFLN